MCVCVLKYIHVYMYKSLLQVLFYVCMLGYLASKWPCQRVQPKHMCVNYICIYTHVCVHTHIYTQRETHIHVYICIIRRT